MASIQYIVELDGARYRLHNQELQLLDEFDHVSGDKFLVTDFNGALHMVRTTNAPFQYVEPVLERDLREVGDLDDIGKILMHRKYKQGSMSTLSYFTPVIASYFSRYEENAERDPDHQLLFGFNVLLLKALDRASSSKPVAILFEHDRHIDILVGNRNRIYAAIRVSSYDYNIDAKTAMLGVISNQLKEIELDARLKVTKIFHYHALLADKATALWVEALKEKQYLAIPVSIAKAAKYKNQQGEAQYSSILPLLADLTLKDAVNQKQMTVNYSAYKLAPWLIAGLMALSASVYASKLYYGHEVNQLTDKIDQLKNEVGGKVQRAKTIQAGYEKKLAEVRELTRASALPLISSIMLELSIASQDNIVFEKIDLSYTDNRLQLDLIGRGRGGGFAAGVPSYNRFIATMGDYQYKLIDSELLTDTESLSFKLTLERLLK